MTTRSNNGSTATSQGSTEDRHSGIRIDDETDWARDGGTEIAQRGVRSRDQSGPDVELYRSWVWRLERCCAAVSWSSDAVKALPSRGGVSGELFGYAAVDGQMCNGNAVVWKGREVAGGGKMLASN